MAVALETDLGTALEAAVADAASVARGHGLDRVLDAALAHDRALADDRALAHDRARTLFRGLSRSRNDFAGADLRDIDLRGVRLNGIRWSEDTTVWPAEYRDRIRRHSVEIAPGLFEVRPGTSSDTADAGVPSDV
jgi:hypothetical protein